jgi:hypothetical protein
MPAAFTCHYVALVQDTYRDLTGAKVGSLSLANAPRDFDKDSCWGKFGLLPSFTEEDKKYVKSPYITIETAEDTARVPMWNKHTAPTISCQGLSLLQSTYTKLKAQINIGRARDVSHKEEDIVYPDFIGVDEPQLNMKVTELIFEGVQVPCLTPCARLLKNCWITAVIADSL